MPQSLSRVLVHLVFSTKGRTPVLTKPVQALVHPYFAGALRHEGCTPIEIGGAEDHVHLLFGLSRTLTLAQAAERIKSGSSKWVKTQAPGFSGFAWQSGYGAFSVGHGEADQVIAYIRNQEKHHAKFSFQEEFLRLLKEHNLEYDERYLWD